MNVEENFDDLPNIQRNIESKLKTINEKSNKNKKIEEDNTDAIDIEEITKKTCINEIDNFEKKLSENNLSLNKEITAKKEEIIQNLENYINKIEKDTNEFIENIEKSNLTEEEKQAEYAKCMEQLDDVISLNETLKKCYKLSEKNLLSFLNGEISPDDNKLISNFLCKNENDLNDNNIYNHLIKKDYSEKIINEMKDPTIRNYIIKSNLDSNGYITLKKFKINNYSDCPNIKEILSKSHIYSHRFVLDEIEQISINNISKKDFKYLFKKDFLNNTREITKSVCLNANIIQKIARTQTQPFMIINEKIKNDIKIDDRDENKNKKIHIKNCDLTDLALDGIFNWANIIKFTSCKLSFNFYVEDNFNLINNITELYLEDCGFVDDNFNETIYAICQNKRFFENVKCLSFKNNNITVLSFFKYYMESEILKIIFKNLEFMDFSNNKIKCLQLKILNSIPIIKVIDLSGNDFQITKYFESLSQMNKLIIDEDYQKSIKKEKQRQEKVSKTREKSKKEEMPKKEDVSKNDVQKNEEISKKEEVAPKGEEIPKEEEKSKNEDISKNEEISKKEEIPKKDQISKKEEKPKNEEIIIKEEVKIIKKQ